MNSRIETRIGVRATSERIWEVLADLENWSRWNPYESVDGRLAFKAPLIVTERFPDQPERVAQAVLADWTPLNRLVWGEKRGWMFSAIRYFEIDQLEPGSCVFATGFDYSGLRGELFHDKHRPAIRAALTEMGEGMKRLAEG